jgi:hypothetical protein
VICGFWGRFAGIGGTGGAVSEAGTGVEARARDKAEEDLRVRRGIFTLEM